MKGYRDESREREALRERYERLRMHDPEALAADIRAIANRAAAHIKRPYLDHAELLYDEHGPSQMILDSSPLVAILAEEPDAEIYIQAISRAPRCRISAGNFIELAIVIESQFGVEVAQQCDAMRCFAALAL